MLFYRLKIGKNNVKITFPSTIYYYCMFYIQLIHNCNCNCIIKSSLKTHHRIIFKKKSVIFPLLQCITHPPSRFAVGHPHTSNRSARTRTNRTNPVPQYRFFPVQRTCGRRAQHRHPSSARHSCPTVRVCCVLSAGRCEHTETYPIYKTYPIIIRRSRIN